MKKDKATRWHKPRHTFCYHLIRPAFKAFAKIKYHLSYERLDNSKRPYLILYNHQTASDQFFVYAMCPKTTYFVATEDLFSMGFVTKFLTYTSGIIPIKKNSTDASAVMTCCRVAREGYSVAIAPEGNRTYTGKTVYITPSIAKMVKLLKLPVAIVNFHGGYGLDPRWAMKYRKGKLHAQLRTIIEPQQYKDMSADELYTYLKQLLSIDEVNDGRVYKDIPTSAQYLERVLYRCPQCGSIGTLQSKGRTFTCQHCGSHTTYHPNKQFDKTFVFSNPNQWWQWQNEQIRQTDINQDKDKAIATDSDVKVDKVLQPKKQLLHKSTTAILYKDRLSIGGQYYMYDDITAMAVCGHNKLFVYHKDATIQLKGNKRFCALKYTNYYYHYKHTMEGVEDGFLGL